MKVRFGCGITAACTQDLLFLNINYLEKQYGDFSYHSNIQQSNEITHVG